MFCCIGVLGKFLGAYQFDVLLIVTICVGDVLLKIFTLTQFMNIALHMKSSSDIIIENP